MAETAAKVLEGAKEGIKKPFSGLMGKHKIWGAVGFLVIILLAYRFRKPLLNFMFSLPLVGKVAMKITGETGMVA